MVSTVRRWMSLWFQSLGDRLPCLSLSGLPQKARRCLQIHGFSSQKHLFFSFPWTRIVFLGKCCRCWAKLVPREVALNNGCTFARHPSQDYKGCLGPCTCRHLEGLILCFWRQTWCSGLLPEISGSHIVDLGCQGKELELRRQVDRGPRAVPPHWLSELHL